MEADECKENHKLRAAQRAALVSVVRTLIRTHPDREALRAAWAQMLAYLTSTDSVFSITDADGKDPEMTALFQQELDQWTAEISRK